MQRPGRPIISVQEARRILGKEASELSDTQVLEIVSQLTLMAKQYMCYTGSKKMQGQSNDK